MVILYAQIGLGNRGAASQQTRTLVSNRARARAAAATHRALSHAQPTRDAAVKRARVRAEPFVEHTERDNGEEREDEGTIRAEERSETLQPTYLECSTA